MTKRSIILATLALLGVMSAPALAQTANKTWVSSASGSDTGTCQFVSPCKTFAYAITQTAPGGELDVKDAGSYGVVTITKAISIVANGVLAAIAVPQGGTGVTVSAGSGDTVILQGLVIDGHGVGKYGIEYASGRSLVVEQCQIRNMNSDGIIIDGTQEVFHIVDTVVVNSHFGVYTNPGNIFGSLSRVDIYDGSVGLTVGTNQIITMDNSTIVNNNSSGINATNGILLIGQSKVSKNADGISLSGGVVQSYGNNAINANGNDVAGGTLGSVAQQ